jgi:hypothetical protein
VDLYLHIGTEKTGTTSVQKFFRANREALAGNGIVYPVAPGNQNHQGLAAAAQDPARHGPLRRSMGIRKEHEAEQYRGDMMTELAEEFRRKPYRLAVMSGEHCSSRLLEDEEVQWLKDQLAPFFDKIYIVVYIRRQDDYLLSTYSTAVKSGATYGLRLPPDRAIQHRYDHWDLLERWARVFGRDAVICRKFERAELKNGDIVDDFLQVVGIDGAPYERPEDVNESLDAESLEFLRLFNKHVPRFVKRKLNPARDNVVPLLGKVSEGPLLTLPQGELDGFIAQFRDSNRKVAIEYFGGVLADSDDPLFAPRSDKRERVYEAVLTPERAVELSAYLWQEKQAQLEKVTERARRLREVGGPLRKQKQGGEKRREGAEEDFEN